MKTNTLRSILAISFIASSACSVASASTTTWDAAADFHAAANPTSAWSYGSTNSIGGSFATTSSPTSLDGLNAWGDFNASVVFHNQTANVQTPAGTIYAAPGIIAEHPGANGQFAVIRWTAPQAGNYTLNFGFFGISAAGQATTTDVHVLKNNSSLFDGLVQGHWANENFRVGSANPLTFSLASNDHIDFVVGRGSNGNYFYDSTRLNATISAVPEPETYAMMLAGLGLLGFMAKRRRQA